MHFNANGILKYIFSKITEPLLTEIIYLCLLICDMYIDIQEQAYHLCEDS